MLTFRMARRTLELEASRGRHGLPTPRDRLPPSYYAEMNYQSFRREERKKREQEFVPGHTRDAVSGKYVSKEAFVNYQCDCKIDGKLAEYKSFFSFHEGIPTTFERRVK